MENMDVEIKEINNFLADVDEFDEFEINDDRDVIVSGVDMDTPTNYERAVNKPQINGVELVDNKTLEDLGIKQEYIANDIKFEDGATFQEKYDSGELKGERGPQGIQGIQGIKGDTGEVGPKGDTGPTGPQGAKGDKGDKGDRGIQGVQGPKGDKGDTGATGPKGDTGPQGPAGKNGTNGTNGKDGKDGYTPVKGTDYYTEEDKQEMVNLVLASLPSSEGVSY